MKRFVVAVFFVFLAWGAQVQARSVTLGWDANEETNLAGYKVHYGDSSGTYTGSGAAEGSSPILVPLSALDNPYFPEFTVSFSAGVTYIAVTAYNTENLESGFSNEVSLEIPVSYPLDVSFSAAGGSIDPVNEYIHFNISSLPAGMDQIYWQKSGISVQKGQIIRLEFNGYYANGPHTETPLIIFGYDLFGNITRERIPFIGDLYGRHIVDVVAIADSDNAAILVACGAQTGYLEFSQIKATVLDPAVPPVENVYLEGLLPTMISGSKFKTSFQIVSSAAADQRIIRVATSAYDIEAGVNLPGYPLYLASNVLKFEVDIGNNLYNGLFYEGFYVAVTNVINGVESPPVLYSYLPGNVVGHPDEPDPPLSLHIAVMPDDYNWVFAHRNNQAVPALDGTPACYWRRANNRVDLLINSFDLSFVSFQRSRGAQMLAK